MGIIRLLLIAATVALGVYLLKRMLAGRPSLPKTPKNSPSKLVQCAYCGVHIAESEAIRAADKHYCSVDHLERNQQS